ncbi:conserved membrane hypothetical protein [Xenorhabdus bovienii str. puntauvense]|uniref:Uncharacterized protein n=1 Tax=Xenorhabdus bovienii str. puntauvense TaxID=1398201 RepID=A0A077NHI5_XENBV|nr:hypothetical protein [Xenorhabdus bovienii]CDG98189.1 conserved membrane hypothetical protein [Xenorhabdus bovienii str. puntauvense]
MNQQKPMTIWHYLLSRDALMTIIIPIVLYNIMFWVMGTGIAVLMVALYSGGVQLFSRRRGSLAIIVLIMVSGVSHYLYLHGYALFNISKENVFLSISGALSVVVVFSFYSFMGQPVVQTMAEQAMPRLKDIPAYGTALYARVWHEVSIVWILVFLLKAFGVYMLSCQNSVSIDTIIFIGGWPLTLLMVMFSFRWPKYRWKSNAHNKE